jgi:hypothetical protein
MMIFFGKNMRAFWLMVDDVPRLVDSQQVLEQQLVLGAWALRLLRHWWWYFRGPILCNTG